jgi:hypothetical protein
MEIQTHQRIKIPAAQTSALWENDGFSSITCIASAKHVVWLLYPAKGGGGGGEACENLGTNLWSILIDIQETFRVVCVNSRDSATFLFHLSTVQFLLRNCRKQMMHSK